MATSASVGEGPRRAATVSTPAARSASRSSTWWSRMPRRPRSRPQRAQQHQDAGGDVRPGRGGGPHRGATTRRARRRRRRRRPGPRPSPGPSGGPAAGSRPAAGPAPPPGRRTATRGAPRRTQGTRPTTRVASTRATRRPGGRPARRLALPPRASDGDVGPVVDHVTERGHPHRRHQQEDEVQPGRSRRRARAGADGQGRRAASERRPPCGATTARSGRASADPLARRAGPLRSPLGPRRVSHALASLRGRARRHPRGRSPAPTSVAGPPWGARGGPEVSRRSASAEGVTMPKGPTEPGWGLLPCALALGALPWPCTGHPYLATAGSLGSPGRRHRARPRPGPRDPSPRPRRGPHPGRRGLQHLRVDRPGGSCGSARGATPASSTGPPSSPASGWSPWRSSSSASTWPGGWRGAWPWPARGLSAAAGAVLFLLIVMPGWVVHRLRPRCPLGGRGGVAPAWSTRRVHHADTRSPGRRRGAARGPSSAG